MKFWIFLCVLVVVQASDLLDLYVEHMDNAMEMKSVNKRSSSNSNENTDDDDRNDLTKVREFLQRGKRSTKQKVNIPMLRDNLLTDDSMNIYRNVNREKVNVPAGNLNLRKKNDRINYNLIRLTDKDNRGLEMTEGFSVTFKNFTITPTLKSTVAKISAADVRRAEMEDLKQEKTTFKIDDFVSKYFPAGNGKRSKRSIKQKANDPSRGPMLKKNLLTDDSIDFYIKDNKQTVNAPKDGFNHANVDKNNYKLITLAEKDNRELEMSEGFSVTFKNYTITPTLKPNVAKISAADVRRAELEEIKQEKTTLEVDDFVSKYFPARNENRGKRSIKQKAGDPSRGPMLKENLLTDDSIDFYIKFNKQRVNAPKDGSNFNKKKDHINYKLIGLAEKDNRGLDMAEGFSVTFKNYTITPSLKPTVAKISAADIRRAELEEIKQEKTTLEVDDFVSKYFPTDNLSRSKRSSKQMADGSRLDNNLSTVPVYKNVNRQKVISPKDGSDYLSLKKANGDINYNLIRVTNKDNRGLEMSEGFSVTFKNLTITPTLKPTVGKISAADVRKAELEDLKKQKTTSKIDDIVSKYFHAKKPMKLSKRFRRHFLDIKNKHKREKYLKKINIEPVSALPLKNTDDYGKNKQMNGIFSSRRHPRNVKTFSFTHHEVLDHNSDVIFDWDPSDDKIVTFRVTARTKGYIGIGFNDNNHMMGADIILMWVDDQTKIVNLLDSHGDEETNATPITDLSQDVQIIEGYQNETHTSVTFSRKWDTCDPDDRELNEDNVKVLWAINDQDPELNAPVWHGEKRGGISLRLKGSIPRQAPSLIDSRPWDVKLNQFAVDEKLDTIYWCKIFKAPPFDKKHHMIGYEAIIEKGNEDLVHHMILYECASTSPILGQHARIHGASCYSPTMPREWESCIQPIVAWGKGSRGEWMPNHVGIPVAEHREGSYYMLEVHYNNPTFKNAIDSSGLRLHVTGNLRPQEAGIFVTGVGVSPLHFIPPQQKEYATAGYCSDDCTNTIFPEDGVNVISVFLHSHLAGRRMSLRHIRKGQELPRIVKEDRFDFNYQQSHSLEKEVKLLRGDELVTECVYGTKDRLKPTLGGYSAEQEMCLAFVIHYPRTELAGCYSMTPAKDLFKTLGVDNFKGVTLDNVEKLFMSTGTDAVSMPVTVQQQLPIYPATKPDEDINEQTIRETETALKAMREFSEDEDDDNVFARLVIDEPEEFRGRTLAEHMLALPWSEQLLTKTIERRLYHGRHVSFCRKRDDKLAIPYDLKMFPNFTKLPEQNHTYCHHKTRSSANNPVPYLIYILVLPFTIIYFK